MEKKILIFCPDFHPRNTGYSNAFQNLISAFAGYDGYVIDVYTYVDLEDSEEIKQPNVNIIRKRKVSNLKFFRFLSNQKSIATDLISLDKKNDYQMVMMETFENVLVPAFLNEVLLKKFVIRIHGCYETERRFFFPGFFNFINRVLVRYISKHKVLNFASTNMYYFEFIKKHFLSDNLYTACNKNFYYLPNTVKEPVKSPVKRVDSSFSNKVKLVSLGRMDHSGKIQKGFSDLFKALYLSKDTIEDKLEMTIIGRGEYLRKYREFAVNLGLGFVKFVEYESHENIIERLEASDVVVLPSRYEGMSMFALESLATSNAVIFTDTGGLSDMCIDGVNGFKIPTQSPEKLSEKLVAISLLNRVELEKMKSESNQLFSRNFTPEIVKTKISQMIELVKRGI